MTLPDYFWDMWPSLAGKLSSDITITQLSSALHLSGVVKSCTKFSRGNGEKIAVAGCMAGNNVWSYMACDFPSSGEMISITNCYIRFIHLLYLSFWFQWTELNNNNTASRFPSIFHLPNPNLAVSRYILRTTRSRKSKPLANSSYRKIAGGIIMIINMRKLQLQLLSDNNRKLTTRWEYPNVTWRISAYLFTYLCLSIDIQWTGSSLFHQA